MRIVLRLTAVFVFAGSLLGQSPIPVSTTKDATMPPAGPAASAALVPQKAAPAVAEMPPNTPIATIVGVCDAPTAKNAAAKGKTKTKNCKTVITKAEMDAMLDTLLPGATQETRHQFALNYIRMVAASGVAREKRLGKDPAVAKELEAKTQFTRMQVMAGSLYHRIEKLAEDVQESELESYYRDNAASFMQAEVQRLSVAKTSVGGAPLDLAALKAKAEEYRIRAEKGEDFEQLQKEIVQALHPGGPVPPTKLGMVHRNGLAPSEAAVFNLKPGEITAVVEGPSGFEILKLVSVQPVPLDAVRSELKTALTNGHLMLLMKDATQGVTGDFNLAYLNLQSTPELFLSPLLQGPGGARIIPPGMAAGGRAGGAMQPGRRATMPGAQRQVHPPMPPR